MVENGLPDSTATFRFSSSLRNGSICGSSVDVRPLGDLCATATPLNNTAISRGAYISEANLTPPGGHFSPIAPPTSQMRSLTLCSGGWGFRPVQPDPASESQGRGMAAAGHVLPAARRQRRQTRRTVMGWRGGHGDACWAGTSGRFGSLKMAVDIGSAPVVASSMIGGRHRQVRLSWAAEDSDGTTTPGAVIAGRRVRVPTTRASRSRTGWCHNRRSAGRRSVRRS
jgi:hypothetical protein